jgi:23S rRNA pseudouridine1911/1915/1917 synthase
MVTTKPLFFRIAQEQDGQRLDKALVSLTGFGRRHVRALFEAHCVSVDGRAALPGHRAQVGTQVSVLSLPATADALTPFELRVTHETQHWVIVDKPAGQPSVPLRGRSGNSVAELLLQRYPEMQDIGYRPSEAGLLHRLDTHTSGLLLAARSRPAFEQLLQALRRGALKKNYYAVVQSSENLSAQSIDLELAPHPKNRRKVAIAHKGGKRAQTRVTVAQRGRHWTLLDVSVDQAYRHQIRIHLSHIGFPLAGDVLYGGARVAQLGHRHALHAHRITVPAGNGWTDFVATSPLPAELSQLLAL